MCLFGREVKQILLYANSNVAKLYEFFRKEILRGGKIWLTDVNKRGGYALTSVFHVILEVKQNTFKA